MGFSDKLNCFVGLNGQGKTNILDAIYLLSFAKSAYNYDGDVPPETTFETLGKGSMKMIALTSMIENELDAEVPVREVMVMKTIGELIERTAEEME